MAELGQLYYTLTAKDEGLAKVIADAKKEFQGMDNAILKLNKTDATGKLNAAFAETGKTIEQVKSQLSILQMQWNKLEFGDSAGRKAIISEYSRLSAILDDVGLSFNRTFEAQKKLSSLSSQKNDKDIFDTQIKTRLSRLEEIKQEMVVYKQLMSETKNITKKLEIKSNIAQVEKEAASLMNQITALDKAGKSVSSSSFKPQQAGRYYSMSDMSQLKQMSTYYTDLENGIKRADQAAKNFIPPTRSVEQVLSMESNTLNQVTAKLAELKRVRGEQSMTDSNYVSNMSRIMQSETALRQQQQQSLEIGIKKETVEQRLNNVLSQQPKTLEGIIAAQKELNSLYGKIDVSDVSKKEQIIAKNKELAASANQYGMSLKNSSATTYDFTTAMSMQATTLDQVKQKMSAIAAARLQENIKTEQGRKNVSELSAEYNKLEGVLERNGVKSRSLNADLLGQGRIMSQLKSYAAMYISVFSAANLLGDLVKITGQFEMQKVALGAIIHSTEKAQFLFSQIQELGLKSPFTTLDLTGYVKQLSAYQIDTNELFGTTSRLADLSAGLGVDMSRLVLAFGQVKSASVLRGQELRQFTEAGIPLVDALAKKFSELNGRAVTTGEVFDIISKRGVSFQMVKDILWEMTDAGGSFYHMQEKIADTTYGKIENLRDAWEKQLNIIGSANKGFINFGIDTLRLVIDNMSTLGSVIKTVLELYGTYRVAMLINTAVTSTMGLVEVAHYAALVASEKAQKLLNTTMLTNPYVAVGAAVLSLAVLLWNLRDSTDANTEALQKFNDEQSRNSKYLDEHKQKVESLIRTVNDEAKSQYERIRALDDLKAMYPSIIKKYIDEEGHLRNLIGLRNELNNTYDNFTLKFDQNQLKSSKERFLKLGAAVNARLGGGQTTGDYSGITTSELQKMLVEEKARYFGLQSKVNDEVKLFNQNKKTITPFLSEVSSDIDKATKSFQKLNKTSSDLGISMPRAGDSETETIKNLSDAYDSATKTIQTYGKSKLKEHSETIANARAVINLVSEIEKKTGVSIRNGKYEKAENAAANKAKRAQEAKNKIQAETDQRKKDLLVMQAEISKIEADAQLEIAQTSIDAMDEGFAKRRAQIALNYKKDFAAASKSAADYLAKLQKESDKQYLINNPNYAKQGKKAPTLTYGSLTTEQKSTYDNFFNVATDKQITETNNAIKELLSANEDFKTQLEQREKQYNDTIYGLNKSRTAQNSAQIDAAIKEAKRIFDEDTSKINLEKLQKELNWGEIFGDLDNIPDSVLQSFSDKLGRFVNSGLSSLSKTDSKAVVEGLTKIQDKLLSNKPFEAMSASSIKYRKSSLDVIAAQKKFNEVSKAASKDSKEYADALNNLSDAQKRNKKDANDLLDSTKKVSDQFNNLFSSINNLGNTLGGTSGEVLNFMSSIGDFAMTSMEGITKLSTAAATSLSTVEKASIILTIISAAISLMKQLDSLLPTSYAKYENYAEKIKNINMLKQAVDDYKIAVSEANYEENNWFGNSKLSEFRDKYDSIVLIKNAYDDLLTSEQAVYKNKSGRGWLTSTAQLLTGQWFTDTVFGTNLTGANYQKAVTSAMDNLRIETRKASKGFIGSGIGGKSQKTEDLRQWVKDNMKGAELFDKDNKLNEQVYQELMDKYSDKLVGQTKETLEQLKKYQDEYNEYIKDLRDFVDGLYSPLVENITDSLWDWLNNGKDALDSFKDYASDTFKDIINDMMQTIVLKEVFSGFQDQIEKLYESYASKEIDINQLSAGVSELAKSLLGNYEEQLPGLKQLLESLTTTINGAGFNIGSDTSRTGISTGISTASQDSIEALTGGVYALMDISATSRNNLQAINASTSNMSLELQNQTVILTAISQINASIDTRLEKVRVSVDNMNLSGIKLKS